jgi:hypothetical protein
MTTLLGYWRSNGHMSAKDTEADFFTRASAKDNGSAAGLGIVRIPLKVVYIHASYSSSTYEP